jgi:hypothetical protein
MGYAAGGRIADGFYFVEEACAAEATGGLSVGSGHWDDVGQVGAPATGLFLAGHRRVALGAASFHGEIMAGCPQHVQHWKDWRQRWKRFSCQRGEADAILDVRWRLAKCPPRRAGAGAMYFLFLQSLTGKSNS